MSNQRDIIVIGSGMDGMVTAAALSKLGHKVLMLAQYDMGYLYVKDAAGLRRRHPPSPARSATFIECPSSAMTRAPRRKT